MTTTIVLLIVFLVPVIIGIGLLLYDTSVLIRQHKEMYDNLCNEHITDMYERIDVLLDKVDKMGGRSLTAYERGRIDDIILALRTLGNEKLISYTEEINFLLKIRNW